MSESSEKRHLFVFTGPDGSGRKTIADMTGTTLELKKVISFTTRLRRQGEQEGQDYHFVAEDVFKKDDRNGAFVETAYMDGHYYGIKRTDIERLLSEHRFAYVIVNPESAKWLKSAYGDTVVRLFLYADRQSLRKRQLERGDGEAVVERRLSHYDEAMAYMHDCEYAFENVDLSHTVFSITNILERYLNRQLLNLD